MLTISPEPSRLTCDLCGHALTRRVCPWTFWCRQCRIWQSTLEPSIGRFAWRGWHHPWDARVGSHVVCCRATDAGGNTQPDEPEWNAGGYAHNGIQRVEVQVG